MSEIKSIPTRYRGHHFRSRLEARWAVFLDSLAVEWRYEDEGIDFGDFGRYLPDFYLPKADVFLEIKPDFVDDPRLVVSGMEITDPRAFKGMIPTSYVPAWWTDGVTQLAWLNDDPSTWFDFGLAGIGPAHFEKSSLSIGCPQGCASKVCAFCEDRSFVEPFIAESSRAFAAAMASKIPDPPRESALAQLLATDTGRHVFVAAGVPEYRRFRFRWYLPGACAQWATWELIHMLLRVGGASGIGLQKACDAARSARFEHGESGAT